ncbi:uncharacterized protein TNCV_3602681 [Trichonephila clavipes]|nr:uncharacterized protein TNCV_3602681 [Trichonephila clavipes]
MAYYSEQAATSAYVFMIQSLLSPLKEVVHIMPVKKIDGEKLFAVVKKTIVELDDIGFKVIGSARKGHLDLRFASARCLEIVCGTIATPTSAHLIKRVIVGSTSACRMILRSSLLLVAPDPVFRAWVPSRVHCSQQFLTAHSERCTWPATRCVD